MAKMAPPERPARHSIARAARAERCLVPAAERDRNPQRAHLGGGAAPRVAGQAVEQVPPMTVRRLAVREGREDVHLPVGARALLFLVVINVTHELRNALLIAEAP